MKSKQIISITTGLVLVGSLLLTVPVFAQTAGTSGEDNGAVGAPRNGMMRGQGLGLGRPMMGGTLGAPRLGVAGKVTAVSGNIITIAGRQGFGTTTPAVNYTVDATNATVRKGNATSTVSSILVGDMISVRGTVTGTNVVATSIVDGTFGRMMGGVIGGITNTTGGKLGDVARQRMASSTIARPRIASSTITNQVIGNGQPVVAGTVSSISGNTLTVKTASSLTYSVDITNAKVFQGQSIVDPSSIVVGDSVVVQGMINGTSVTATTVIDQREPARALDVNGRSDATPKQGRGMLGGIGQFFIHLFGF